MNRCVSSHVQTVLPKNPVRTSLKQICNKSSNPNLYEFMPHGATHSDSRHHARPSSTSPCLPKNQMPHDKSRSPLDINPVQNATFHQGELVLEHVLALHMRLTVCIHHHHVQMGRCTAHPHLHDFVLLTAETKDFATQSVSIQEMQLGKIDRCNLCPIHLCKLESRKTQRL